MPRKLITSTPIASTSDMNISCENNLQQVSEILLSLTQTVANMQTSAINSSVNKNNTSGLQSVPEFDPSNEVSNVQRWIANIDQLGEVYGWSEQTKIFAATSNLRGYAKTWYTGLNNLCHTWDEWKSLLAEAFPSERDYDTLLRKMLDRVRRPQEDLLKYYYEKLALINACDIKETKKVSLLISGLNVTTIKHAARVGNFKTPENLLEYLKTIELESPRDPVKFKSTHSPATYNGNRNRCFTCRKHGHLQANCPNKRLQRKTLLATNSKVKSDEKYVLIAYLNGKPLKAFVDFGSSVMTIKSETVRELNLIVNKEITCEIRGFGGGSVKTLGLTKPLTLTIDQVTLKLDFWVIPDVIQSFPLIIGQPFTDHPDVLTVKNDSTLRFLRNNKNNNNDTLKTILYAKSNTIIPQNYVGLVECYGNSSGEFYVEGKLNLKEGEENVIPNCILKIEAGIPFKVPVTNLSNKEITITENNVIARARPCTIDKHFDVTLNDDVIPLTEADVIINENLTHVEKEQLLLLINKFRMCFATNVKEIGCTDKLKMPIILEKQDVIKYRPYRMAISERENVKKIINELLGADIIRESESPFSSPILLVSKPNGDKRLCVDYRKLNAITVKDRHPLPLIEDQLDNLRDYQYYTKLDLFSGYYQIAMEENAKQKTAFVTCDGHYEFNRMPFGLTNAPSIFQKVMTKILSPLGSTVASAYLDDIISPAKSFDEGIKKLELIFRTLLENGLTLNPTKCCFFQNSVNYLGFEINKDGVKPGENKIKAVEAFPLPKSVHNVRQFLGLTGFFRKFVKNYAHITKPLSNLLKKDEAFKWEEEQQLAFEKLKRILISRPLLSIFDPNARTEVHTDACKSGIAGILLQENTEKQLKPVSYYSRQTNKCETKYHSYELEVLAIVETLKRYRVYLLGKPFKIVTDCSAVKTCSTKKDLLPRIARWWLVLQEYSFEIEHRAGTKMRHVDALSRNAVQEKPVDFNESYVFQIQVDDWILVGQQADIKLKAIHDILLKKPIDSYENSIHKEYKLINNRVHRKINDKYLWVVPRQMRRDVVRMCHDENGHFAVDKTVNKLLEGYWFPKLRNYVTNYISSCIQCLYNKKSKGPKQGFLHPIDKVIIPFHTLHVDHLGPLPRSGGKKYIFAVIDGFTKYIQLCATKDTSTAPVIRFLKQIFNVYGVPTRIVSDRGSAFTSRNFRKFCQELNIKHVQNAVATPRANGQIERYNATLIESLRSSIKKETEWQKNLMKIQFALNNVINTATNRTPAELLMGYRPRNASEAVLNNEVQPDRPTVSSLTEMREEVRQRVKRKQEQQKEKFDKKRKKGVQYKVGDMVLVEKPTHTEGSKKLLPQFKGPFKIVKILDHDRYVIKDVEGSNRSQKNITSVEAVDKLKPWITSTNISSSSEDELV